MDLQENFREGLRSIKANLLRSILTAAIIAIGILSLVGILTAIDGIQQSVTDSLAELGVNKFDIYSKSYRGSRQEGVVEKSYAPISLKESMLFIKNFDYPANVSLSTELTSTAEVKRGSVKTEPNVEVKGANEDYLILEGIDIEEGRNFSLLEIQYGSNVAIIGPTVKKSLFKDEQAINKEISLYGGKFRVIGVLEEKGRLEGGGSDNSVVIPLIAANKLSGDRVLRYRLSVGIDNSANMEEAMGEATATMRSVRKDPIGAENSFELSKSETLSEQLDGLTSRIRLGGIGIAFITLLGASVALVNIMLVSVTERTREVGVRKALGATPKKIRQQFLIEAIVVCLIGGIVGIILGIVAGNIFSVMVFENFVIPWLWMFIGVTVCVLVGLVSGYYPAYKASKVDPIESLRFE
ncbi:MAG: ABC transporter permease [Candidatus Cyclobacteriaceae bacterium M2_1C_046]